MANTIIYTDGSALAKNVNLGGWAFCKINQSNDIELRYGTSDNSDSNSMELLAVIKALESVESKGRIKIISDSQYVIHGAETKFKHKKVKKEKGEDTLTAAIREIQEETGLSGHFVPVKPLHNTYHVYKFKERSIFKENHWFHLKYTGSSAVQPQIEEGIASVFWLDEAQWKQRLQETYPGLREMLTACF